MTAHTKKVQGGAQKRETETVALPFSLCQKGVQKGGKNENPVPAVFALD